MLPTTMDQVTLRSARFGDHLLDRVCYHEVSTVLAGLPGTVKSTWTRNVLKDHTKNNTVTCQGTTRSNLRARQ